MKAIITILLAIVGAALLIVFFNSPPKMKEDIAQPTAVMINNVLGTRTPLVKKYPGRYALLMDRAEQGLDNIQCYALPNFMGQDYFYGYEDMNTYDTLIFPRDHKAQLDFQFGWYFWSGNFLDTNGNEIDIVVVFFRRALYPPRIADKLGLSALQNQLVQTVVAVNYADLNLHVTGSNPIISGTSGEITYGIEPFTARVGLNSAVSLQNEKMFPMKIEVNDPVAELSIDLNLDESKPLLLQGDNGKEPSIFGMGTWYYSFPNIKTWGTVTYQGEPRTITGKMWMDHQWMAGISPTGYPKNLLVQAVVNIKEGLSGETPKSFGWDWSDVQFDDNTEVTFASPHPDITAELKNMGEDPPEPVTRAITGKYIDESGKGENITGTVTITQWMRSPRSHAWYPNGWLVKIPGKNLEFTMASTVDDQFIYSAASEIREGGVIVKGTKDGTEISGYGFGEGVNYSGLEFALKENMALLGIEDNATNRQLLVASPPGTWLIIQSFVVLASPVALIVLVVLLLVLLFKRKKHADTETV
ncbi:lipocalin-like domain-containing protein [Bacteroidota bacterium]